MCTYLFSTVRTWSSIYFPGSHQFYHCDSIPFTLFLAPLPHELGDVVVAEEAVSEQQPHVASDVGDEGVPVVGVVVGLLDVLARGVEEVAAEHVTGRRVDRGQDLGLELAPLARRQAFGGPCD